MEMKLLTISFEIQVFSAKLFLADGGGRRVCCSEWYLRIQSVCQRGVCTDISALHRNSSQQNLRASPIQFAPAAVPETGECWKYCEFGWKEEVFIQAAKKRNCNCRCQKKGRRSVCVKQVCVLWTNEHAALFIRNMPTCVKTRKIKKKKLGG